MHNDFTPTLVEMFDHLQHNWFLTQWNKDSFSIAGYQKPDSTNQKYTVDWVVCIEGFGDNILYVVRWCNYSAKSPID